MTQNRKPALILVVASLALVAAFSPRTQATNDAANQAWSARLTAQADAYAQEQQEQRALDAYRDRLVAQGRAHADAVAQRERADQAAIDRLNGQARQAGVLVGMDPRVAAAWTARLEGLADYLGSR